MKRIFTFVFILSLTLTVCAQERIMYRLILADKGTSSYSIEEPEKFLTEKSIERRLKQGFTVDESDLPISSSYIEAVEATGAIVQSMSKWVMTVVVEISNEEQLEMLGSLPFIEDYYPVWKDEGATKRSLVYLEKESPEINKNDYGLAWQQLVLQNGHFLHELGFRGEGITIAVMDGGFTNVDVQDYFDMDKIIEVKNFSHEDDDPLRGSQDHGTKVLSCLMAEKKGEYIGTAPDARYYLFKTEMNTCEYPIEEDYWVEALEYADYLGVDLVSSSLGYFHFSDSSMNHTYEELDGQTTFISRAASMAAHKGMIICNSAGNEGNKDWKQIIFPADAKDILTIGGVQADSLRSAFSSMGYTADNRVKPDVMAMATYVPNIGAMGLGYANGTSFSCPIMSGMTACLWQALPDLNSLEIMSLIRESADKYDNPNPLLGYGIPDMYKAYVAGLSSQADGAYSSETDYINIDSNNHTINIAIDFLRDTNAYVEIYNMSGAKLFSRQLRSSTIDYSLLNTGIYIVALRWDDKRQVKKFIRQ